MERTSFKINKVKSLSTVFIALLFVGLGFFLINKGGSNSKFSPLLTQIVGYASILFFSLVGTISVLQFIKMGDVFYVDADGIFDDSSYVSPGHLSWEEVKDISLVKVGRQYFIVVAVNDADAVINRYGKFKQVLVRANLRRYGSPVLISLNNFKDKPTEVFQKLEAAMQKLA